tara:strand:- start:2430 stop:3575 length:1146 start_codon:yes stop_codon:yes gene_type:complete
MKLLFLTGSRSDWGYIKPILKECKNQKIKSHLCVTNMLLLDSFGYGIKEILNEGFKVDEEIYMSLDGYNNYTTSKSMGIFMISFTDVVKKYKPDWVVLAGDRFETLAASVVCAYTNTPMAHIQAGELSGNIDGSARHAIGKFSHIHFASNEDAAKRLIKLGEEKFRIKKVGAPQLDEIYQIKISKKPRYNDLIKKYTLPESKKYYLVIFHSVTEEIYKIKKQINILLDTLTNIENDKVWILPNNDPGSSIIREILLRDSKKKNKIYENFPRADFLQVMSNSIAIIGNSSAGIIEAPSFYLPAINIGRRQNKRLRAKNVIDVKEFKKNKILEAIEKGSSKKFRKEISKIINPYGDGNSSKRIVEQLKKMKKDKRLIAKILTY